MTGCQDCDAGKYCDQMNATSVTGNCDAGFYCESGSSSPTPDGSDGKFNIAHQLPGF